MSLCAVARRRSQPAAFSKTQFRLRALAPVLGRVRARNTLQNTQRGATSRLRKLAAFRALPTESERSKLGLALLRSARDRSFKNHEALSRIRHSAYDSTARGPRRRRPVRRRRRRPAARRDRARLGAGLLRGRLFARQLERRLRVDQPGRRGRVRRAEMSHRVARPSGIETRTLVLAV